MGVCVVIMMAFSVLHINTISTHFVMPYKGQFVQLTKSLNDFSDATCLDPIFLPYLFASAADDEMAILRSGEHGGG